MNMHTVTARGRWMTAAGVLALMVFATMAPSASQTRAPQPNTSVWGSSLYRAEITVAGTNVTGTFTSLANPSAPAGQIAGQLSKDGNAFTAEWTRTVGADTVRFKTWLRSSADNSVMNGFRWSEGGQPSAFSLHRAVNGQVPVMVGPDDVAQKSRSSSSSSANANPSSRPDTNRPVVKTPAPQGDPIDSAPTYASADPSASTLIAREYDRNNFSIRLRLKWTKAGSVLDTVGINAAPVGSFVVSVDPEGMLSLQVYAPAVNGPNRLANGWHVINANARTRPGQVFDLTVTRRPGDWSLVVSGNPATYLTLAVPASGTPVYLGDFPGDNNWPAANRPLRGFVGEATVVTFSGRIR